MIVLDASAIMEVVLDRPSYGSRVAQHLLQHAGDLHAPHLIDAEVGQVLRRYVLRKWMRVARAIEAIELLVTLEVTRYPHIGLLDRALELRRNLTVYDALYVALAEALDAPLLTRDAGIARSAGRIIDIIHIA